MLLRRARTLATFAATAGISALAPSSSTAAQDRGGAIVIGRRDSVQSEILGEWRRLLISRPSSYETSALGYPVLYLLDGDAHFHHTTGVVEFLSRNLRIPEMIVVAVPNTDRGRDLTPPTADTGLGYHTGGADQFLRFLTDELAPWVARNLRTEPYRILVGHSFGGLFAIHSLFERPESFDGYVAVSPSLWWNSRTLLRRAAEVRRFPTSPVLYVTMGNENPARMLEPVRELVRLWEEKPPAGLDWRYRYLEADDHGTTPHRTIYDALESIFTGWRLPDSLIYAGDVSAVESHYAGLSTRYGFRASPPAPMIDAVGRALLRQGKPEQALAAFRRAIALYPGSASAAAGLGAALEALGHTTDALSAYEKALQFSVRSGDSSTATYEREVVRLRSKLP